MNNYTDKGKTFTAGELLVKYRRVKISAANTVTYADAGEIAIGVTMQNVASGGKVGVKLFNDGGTFCITAGEAIAAGANVYGAADGKIADTAVGPVIGQVSELASADLDDIEMIPVPSVAEQTHVADFTVTTDLTGVDTGTDMTAAQAGQIGTDLAAIAVALNAALAVLEANGLTATS